jgi:hypothetical protein
MMTDPYTVAEQIKAALRMVEGLNVPTSYDSKKLPTIFPAAIVGMPELQLEGMSSLPSGARYPVALMVADNADAARKLLTLVSSVAQTIRDNVEDAEIPLDGVFPAIVDVGGTELPGYMILVEV